MKPTTAISVIVVVLFGAFILYSSSPQDTNTEVESEQATVVEPLTEEKKADTTPSGDEGQVVEINSFQGLDEEFNHILEGESRLQEDFMRLEAQNTATTAGN